jgi:serine/threonine protein kinase
MDHKRTVFRVGKTKVEFNIDSKYQLTRELGAGTYGLVCLCEDTEKKEQVAIKKISNPFKSQRESKLILREATLLRALSHPQIVKLKDLIPPVQRPIRDVYMVTEALEADMHTLIHHPVAIPLSEAHIKMLLYQTLRGVEFLHLSGVIHRDLKPCNLLITKESDVRICDFGMARTIHEVEPGALSEYVVTRAYRAPEVMARPRRYDTKIDIWSVGCIFAELLFRCVLFQGKEYQDHLASIIRTLGSPTPEELKMLDPQAAQFIASIAGGPFTKVPWRTKFPLFHHPPEAYDLLDKLLTFNPARRLSASEAMRHPYLAAHHQTFPPNVGVPRDRLRFDWERPRVPAGAPLLDDHTAEAIMWREICHYRPYLRDASAPGAPATPSPPAAAAVPSILLPYAAGAAAAPPVFLAEPEPEGIAAMALVPPAPVAAAGAAGPAGAAATPMDMEE